MSHDIAAVLAIIWKAPLPHVYRVRWYAIYACLQRRCPSTRGGGHGSPSAIMSVTICTALGSQSTLRGHVPCACQYSSVNAFVPARGADGRLEGGVCAARTRTRVLLNKAGIDRRAAQSRAHCVAAGADGSWRPMIVSIQAKPLPPIKRQGRNRTKLRDKVNLCVANLDQPNKIE